jgi:hypothetical protein
LERAFSKFSRSAWLPIFSCPNEEQTCAADARGLQDNLADSENKHRTSHSGAVTTIIPPMEQSIPNALRIRAPTKRPACLVRSGGLEALQLLKDPGSIAAVAFEHAKFG